MPIEKIQNMIQIRNSFFTLVATLFLAANMLAGCELSTTKVAQDKEDAVLNKQDQVLSQKNADADYQKFRTESAARVIKNSQIITDFKIRIMTGEKAMKARYQKRLSELEKKNNDMGNKLEQYSETGSDEREIFISKWDHDMGLLVKSLNDMTKNNN